MLIFAGVVAALLLAALGYQELGRRADLRRFPAPGRLIRSGSRSWHLHEQGTGVPAVVLEAGIAGTSLGWSLVQGRIADFARTVSYDRAGLGWSGRCTGSRTVDVIVRELAECLAVAGVPGPYVLVGHSFGGLIVRAFAATYPENTAGLVLVDPVSVAAWANGSPEELRRLRLGVGLSRRGAWLARFGVVRATLYLLASGGRFLPRLIGRASAGRGSSVMTRLIGEVQKLPRELWPVIRSHWSDAKCFEGMAAYLECLPGSARAASSMTISPAIPVTVLSGDNATEAELVEREAWVAASDAGKHVRVARAGHWIQLDQPDAVVEAVSEMKRLLRA